MSYLLDTNVVSEPTRPAPHSSVLRWLAEVEENLIFASVITLGELQFGLETLPRGRRYDSLERWLELEFFARFGNRLLPVTDVTARTWGVLSAKARARGITLGTADGLLAATAQVHDLTLVTRDVRDFSGLGIRLLDPWQSRPHPR